MKRNAVAVAVGALFIAPAAQAQIMFGNDTIGTVQFYGKLYPQFGWARSSGATQPGESVSTLVSSPSGVLPGAAVSDTPSRQAVDSQNSYLGFRGERSFGTIGLKAIWQIEQSVNLDTGTGTFSNRNSFVGLRSNFGTVKLGNMDTIYKDYGDTFQMFGVSSGNFVSASNVLSHIGIGNNSAARFHERRANSIQLESAQYGGFTGGFQYSPDEAKANGLNASLYSYGVKWEGGPFYVSLHQERHNDFFGGSLNIPTSASGLRNATSTGGVITPMGAAHSRDTGTRLSAEYRIGGHRFVGDIARLEYKESGQAAGTKFESYKHTNWAIGWDARWSGPWRTAIQYVVGGEGTCTLTGGTACSTSGLKGTMLNVGVAYSLDRQTFLYGIAGRLTNGKSSLYDNWANADPARGADITQAALGISYIF